MIVAFSSECYEEEPQIQKGPAHGRFLTSRSPTLGPLRIHFYKHNLNFNTQEANDFFNDNFLPRVQDFFTNALQVYNIRGKLSLAGYSMCADVPIPEDHIDPGVRNADIIIYIKFSDTVSPNYIAMASACILDTGFGNVIAGRITLAQDFFKDMSSLAIYGYKAFLHEITHLLGFSRSLYEYWRKPNGELYEEGELHQAVTLRGTTKYIMVTPTVVEKAREAFGCSTLAGLELEEYNQPYPSSHWDERVMLNDYMTSTLGLVGHVSTISLAMLQDSGWYQVNFDMGEHPYVGRNKGCDFIEEKCVNNGVSNDDEIWCTENLSSACDALGINKAGCSFVTSSEILPAQFQYFSNPYQGGSDPHKDHCPLLSTSYF